MTAGTTDARYGAPLSRLAAALDVLIADDDLDEAKLREASEGLLPALADALHSRGAYKPDAECHNCKKTRGENPDVGFFIDGNSPILPGQRHPPKLYYSCEDCL